jgi:hypothetical protein
VGVVERPTKSTPVSTPVDTLPRVVTPILKGKSDIVNALAEFLEINIG